jgi:hypothetical protein
MAPLTQLFDLSSAGPIAGVECRVWERHPCDLQTSCQPLASRGGGDFMWGGTVRDISANGIGLLLNRRFEPGTRLVIELPSLACGTRQSVLARVVHATPLAIGFWLLGCVFSAPLPEDEFHALIGRADPVREEQPQAVQEEQPQAAPTVDCLTAAFAPSGELSHTPFPGKVVLIHKVLFETTTAQGTSVRVLVNRLRLRASWPLAAGTPLKIWVGHRRRDKPLARVVVASCGQQDGLWVVNYAFEETPSAEMLRSLGHPEA